MQAALWNLTINMRSLGSKFTLSFAVFISSALAFLMSSTIIRFFGAPLSTFEILEAIPFLVVAIGFEKPFQLTKAVYQSVEDPSSAPLRKKIFNGLVSVSNSIVTEYLTEFFILIIGSLAGFDATIGRICSLGALLIVADALCLFAFYMPVLTLKIELRRLYLHDAAKSNATFYSNVKKAVDTSQESKRATTSMSQKIMGRAKLIMILTFVIGHVITSSGNAEIFTSKSQVLGSSRMGQSSVLLSLGETETFMVQAGQPLILHPTWYF